MSKSSGITTRRSRLKAAVAVTGLVLAGALAAPLVAFAADGPYDINGTIPDANTTPLTDVYGSVKELGPLNSNTTKIGVIHNDAVPTLGLTNPNAQVDLRGAWLDIERDTSTGHDWLYFAWERDSNSGSGFIAYEFMHNPAPAGCAYDTATNTDLIADCNPWANRTAGDFMILWDQQGNSRDLYLRTWSGVAPNLTLGAPTLLNADVSQAAYGSGGFRGEAAVDLTATIFKGSTACISFANTIPSTVTGNSDTADYKDTILMTAPTITNCGSVNIVKTDDQTTPHPLSGATFTLYENNAPLGGNRGGEDTITDLTCTTVAAGTCTIGDVFFGTYWVVETTVPAGYTKADDRAVLVTNTTPVVLNLVDPRILLQPTITTAQRFVPNDSATVEVSSNSQGNLDGNVRFRLYDNATCDGADLYDSGNVSIATGTGTGTSMTVSSSNTTAFTVDTTFSWLVEYTTSNTGHLNVTSVCDVEHSSITINNHNTPPE